jgi:hypothetical protein
MATTLIITVNSPTAEVFVTRLERYVESRTEPSAFERFLERAKAHLEREREQREECLAERESQIRRSRPRCRPPPPTRRARPRVCALSSRYRVSP